MDARQRYEVTAMVIPPQQHPPTNEQAALDYAGENFHHVEDIMLNRPWPATKSRQNERNRESVNPVTAKLILSRGGGFIVEVCRLPIFQNTNTEKI